MRCAGARVHARLMQPTTPLVEGAAFLPSPGKDLADHLSFVEDAVIAGVSASFLLAHLPVPRRRLAEESDAPRLSGVPLAPATPFAELGPLVFGHDPLDLE